VWFQRDSAQSVDGEDLTIPSSALRAEDRKWIRDHAAAENRMLANWAKVKAIRPGR
jgi:hypothetical protein